MPKADFNSNALLEKLNSAAEKDAYKQVLAFLNDSWGLDFAGRTTVKPWTISGSNNDEKKEENKPGSSSGSQSTGSSSAGSSRTSGTAANPAPTKQIVDEATPLAGNSEKNVVVKTADNNTAIRKSTNSKSKKVASTEEEVSTEDEATEDSTSEENVEDVETTEDSVVSSDDNVETIEDEEVPEAAGEITEADATSSNVMLIIVFCVLALAALGFFGFQLFNARKGK